MLTFRKMIYVLISIIVLLSLAIVALSIDLRRTRLRHQRHVAELQFAIVQLTENNAHQLQQIKLSDELRKRLMAARHAIDRDLMDVQHDMAQALAKGRT